MHVELADTGAPGRGPVSKSPGKPPLIWLLMGYRAGENSQILALGEALDLPFQVKRVRHRRYEFVTSLLRGTGLSGIVRSESSPLEPPWPDVVISAGAHNEPVCRWIRDRSGGSARIVFIGRPWAPAEQFDLVVTTPQYRLAEHPRVLQNTLTLHRITQARLDEAAAHWAPRLIQLPRPWVAVVMGGNSGPYTLGLKAARRLGREASALARRLGGSVLVTTSFRTSASAATAMEEALDVPFEVYRWSADASENPYHAYLALADALVVTGDSIAMLSEACATCKPVYIFDLGDGPDSMRRLAAAERGPLGRRALWRSGVDFRLGGDLYWQLMRLGPTRLTRDLGLVHKRLIDSGRAVFLGDTFPAGKVLSTPDDVARAVARVKALL